MTFNKKDTMTIKGIAILLLLFYHLFAQTWVYANFEVSFLLDRELVVWLAKFGNICVAIFLFLSAYGITTSFLKMDKERLTVEYTVKKTLLRTGILLSHFLVMYVSIWLIWFSKLTYGAVYGQGKQSILFAITDALGLAEIFDTPTLCMTWWYMEIAILCIIFIPIMQAIYYRVGNLLLILIVLLPSFLSVDLGVYKYIFVMALGLCAANGDWIRRIKKWKISYLVKVLFSLLAMILTFLLRSNSLVKDYYEYVTEGLVAFVWIVALSIIVGNIPLLTKAFQFLGKHSMNIFFFHTFIYLILYRDQIYGLEYSGLIFSAVFGISLLYSLVIEFIKNKLSFYRLVNKIKGE